MRFWCAKVGKYTENRFGKSRHQRFPEWSWRSFRRNWWRTSGEVWKEIFELLFLGKSSEASSTKTPPQISPSNFTTTFWVVAGPTNRSNRKGGTASLRARTCVKRNFVFGARFKGLPLHFLYQRRNLIRVKTGLDTCPIRIQTRTPLSRCPPYDYSKQILWGWARSAQAIDACSLSITFAIRYHMNMHVRATMEDHWFRNEKSAQRGSFRPDIPADIPPKTSVRRSKSWKRKHFGTDIPCGRPRKKTSGWKTSGWILVPYWSPTVFLRHKILIREYSSTKDRSLVVWEVLIAADLGTHLPTPPPKKKLTKF